MKNILNQFTKQNNRLSYQISLFLGQTTLLVCLMVVSFTSLQAQVLPIDFSLSEDAFYGDGGASFEITTNNPDIINGGDGQIGKITTSGAAWENVQLDLSTYLDLTTSNKTITFDFYSTTVVPVLLKLEGGLNGGAPIEVSVTSTDTGWQTMTYVFATADEQYTKLVIFPDAGGTSAGTYYIDDIAGGANGENTSPSSVPTAPTNDSIDVISLFSDEYTPVDGVNIDPNWGQATDSQIVTIGGEEVLRYINLNYQGLVWDEMDVSTMEYLHFDYWTQNPNMDLNFSLIESGVLEVLFDVDAGGTLTTGQWVSLDIPMSYFINGNLDLSNVDQIKTSNGPGNIFLDNIYFWRDPVVAGTDATLSDLQVDSASLTGFSSGGTSYTYAVPLGSTVPQITAATTTDAFAQTLITQATSIPGDATVVVTAQNGTTTQIYTVSYEYGPASPPARDAGDVISIFSEAYTDITGTNFNPGWGQSGAGSANTNYVTADGNTLLYYPNFNFQGIDFSGNSQDASNMQYLHLDVWTSDDFNLQVTPINSAPGTGVTEILVPITYTTSSWTSVDIPIGDFTGMNWDNVIQIKFDGGNGSEAFFVDNIYFWKPSAGDDATLSDLQVDSATISGFAPGVTSYTYEVAGSASIPQITSATTTQPSATTSITQATSIPGAATVVVTSSNGSTTNTYSVTYAYSSPPTSAPAPPSRYATDVISIFGDTYTNVPVDDYNPNWGQSGYGSANTSYDPGDGSTLLYYPNFGYQGIQLVDGHDASDMEYLHVDLFTTSTSAIKVSPINSGTGPGDALQTISHTIGSWTSVDIPIEDFLNTSVNEQMTWDNVIQMKFDGGNLTTDAIYVDNIYFWKAPTCTSSTTWDGASWSNGAPGADTYVIIDGSYSTATNGTLRGCVVQVDAAFTIDGAADAEIGEVLVTTANTLTIDETSSLKVSGKFTNNGTVTLNSTADDFSSLIVEGSAIGEIVYNRHVNAYNATTGGGWDGTGPPVAMSIADFITDNTGVIYQVGDTYALGPFNNLTNQYEYYTTTTASTAGGFTPGKGYTMATANANGATVKYTGTIATTSQSIDVTNNDDANAGVGRRWNFVSNPYPSYINGNSNATPGNNFMDVNSGVIDGTFLGVYGWNGSSYTTYNNTSDAFSIAPGQGFFVAAASTTATALDFTTSMRTTTGTGDFVLGPQPLIYKLELKLSNGEMQKAATKFYFRDGLSLDLDPGYDAGAFNQSVALSTRLPQGSQEFAFEINAMGIDAIQNTRVPLEIRQNTGQTFTISIEDMELPEDIYVYLEDTVNGTLTSLKEGDFELVAQSDLSGADRFFIIFKSNSVLSSGDTLGVEALNVYKANNDDFVTIAGINPDLGQLDVTLYNIIGQTVSEKSLNTTTATQRVSTKGLASGLYMVQIKSGNQTTVKKVIVK